MLIPVVEPFIVGAGGFTNVRRPCPRRAEIVRDHDPRRLGFVETLLTCTR